MLRLPTLPWHPELFRLLSTSGIISPESLAQDTWVHRYQLLIQVRLPAPLGSDSHCHPVSGMPHAGAALLQKTCSLKRADWELGFPEIHKHVRVNGILPPRIKRKISNYRVLNSCTVKPMCAPVLASSCLFIAQFSIQCRSYKFQA